MKAEENTPECYSCKADRFRQQNGAWESQEARSHWMLYGCTCEPEAEKEVEDWIKLVAD